jgi:HK97 family phage prohead protease
MNHKHAQLKHKQFAFKASAVNEDGTFTGYGSVFGTVDCYNEVVAKGAFAESLQELAASGDPMPALWQHNSDQPIGGYDTLEEDDTGLKVAGFLMINEVAQAREAHALMKRRVVKGLSIGYYVRADSYDEKTRIRTLTKLDLQEISIVTFPANEDALIDTVKQKLASGELPTLPQFEKLLREAGFSSSQAKAIANGGLSKLLRREVGNDEEANTVKRALAALTS